MYESGTGCDNESVGREEDEFIGTDEVSSDSSSCFSSDCSEDSSIGSSLSPADTNKFLDVVINSLAIGFEYKLTCDFLILEINASRYAYNIQLHEVNFFVVRALLSLPPFDQSGNILYALYEVIKYFRPIFKNYIQCKSAAMDCLRAVEEICIQCEWLKGNCDRILHILYYQNIIDKKYMVEYYKQLRENDSRLLQYHSVTMFFEWLQEDDEESNE